MASMMRAVPRLMVVASLGGLLGAGSAYAQAVPEGATVKIKAVSPQDAYFKQRKPMIGLICGVEAPGLDLQGKGKKWMGGSMTCADGQNYYFYKVAVEIGAFGIDYEALTGHAVGETLEPEAGVMWPVGARVRLLDISAEDSHVDDKGVLAGKSCTVADNPLASSGEGWFSGQLACDGTASRYFYQVSVADPGKPPQPSVETPVAASEFPAGKMVKIVDIAAADALYASRSTIVGRTCSVVESPLFATGEGYYAGRLFCDDGKSYQAFQFKVSTP